MLDSLSTISLVWFGAFSAVLGFFFVVALATRSYFWAAGLAIAFFVISHFTPFSAFAYVVANWPQLVMWGAIYLMFGSLWAVFAWVLYLHKQRSEYRERREHYLVHWLREAKLTAFDPALHSKAFGDYMRLHTNIDRSLTLSKSTVAEQILFWPLKIVAFFIGDFIRVFVDAFMSLFGGLFSKIRNYMFRDFPELHR